jgi:hypothetical protein
MFVLVYVKYACFASLLSLDNEKNLIGAASFSPQKHCVRLPNLLYLLLAMISCITSRTLFGIVEASVDAIILDTLRSSARRQA